MRWPESLSTTLRERLGAPAGEPFEVTVVPSPYASSYPAAVIECRSSRRCVKLFAKHAPSAEPAGRDEPANGGLEQEIVTYQEVLSRLALPVSRFYGGWRDPRSGECWLVMEYHEGAVHLSKSTDPQAMVRAAEWAGALHAAGEDLAATSVLRALDPTYFRSLAASFLRWMAPVVRKERWLGNLCEHVIGSVETVFPAPRTVVHGEFYPRNVLECGGRVIPVDWESAAIAFGELDLAALLMGWGDDVARSCRAAYAEARWHGAPPAEFERNLAAAELCLGLREWPRDRLVKWGRLLRTTGERLGLL